MKLQEYIAIVNRFVALASTLVIMLLNIHYVGVAGQGEISLINFGILIFVSISQFIGGGGLVYLIPRFGEQKYLLPAYIWTLASGTLALIILSLLAAKNVYWILLLGFLQSHFTISQMLLLSRARINRYQLLLFIQASLSIVGIAWSYHISDHPNVFDFIRGQIIAFALTTIIGWILTFSQLAIKPLRVLPGAYSSAFSLGAYTQTGNIFHLLNQRSYLFFLEKISLELAGIYSIVNYLSEGILSVTKSLAAVQNSIIAQDDNHDSHYRLTKKYLAIGLLATAAGILAIALVPESWLNLVFKSKTTEIKSGFFYLSPGILAASITATLAHYFSGKGLQKYNAISAISGFIVAVPLSAWLIPHYLIPGACAAASAAFITQCGIQSFLFLKTKKLLEVK